MANVTIAYTLFPLTMLVPLLLSLIFLQGANAGVTVWSQKPLATATDEADLARYTGAAAYNPTVLTAPPLPNPPPPNQFFIQLQSTADGVRGLSIPQKASFWGFSIEFSVINELRT